MLKSELTLIDSADLQPRWFRVEDVIHYSTIPRTTVYELINNGTLRTACLKKKGNKNGIRLVEKSSLDEFIAKHTSGGTPKQVIPAPTAPTKKKTSPKKKVVTV